MSSLNIRTVNGAKHNGYLHVRHQRIQNRAAAILDVWEEHGEALSIDLIAHLHRISVEQIKKDLFGDPTEIKQRFSGGSSIKLESLLEKCMKEINEGINPALSAVAHSIPFKLLKDAQKHQDIKRVVTEFLQNLDESSENDQDDDVDAEAGTKSINVRQFKFTRNFLIFSTDSFN